VALAACALGLAAAGAAANLRLLEPRSEASSPLVLAPTTTGDATTTEGHGTSTTTPAPETSTTVSVTSSSVPGTTAPPSPPPPTSTTTASASAPPRTYAVGAAGSVTLSVRNGQIALEAVAAAAGWSPEVDKQEADEVEISFRSAEGEASLHARLENGQLSVEIDSSDSPDD
jgi:hypothetical protein